MVASSTTSDHLLPMLTRARLALVAPAVLHRHTCCRHCQLPEALTCIHCHRHAAVVQGVPDWVRFHGSCRECYKQVGNAVPVPLAEALGRHLPDALRLAEQQQHEKAQHAQQQRRQR